MNEEGAETDWLSSVSIALGIWFGYVLLYQLNSILMGTEAFGGIASLIFLPAFVRLLGFLFLGLWAIVPLFFAALICVDLGLNFFEQFFVSLALSCGAPLALRVICSIIKISPMLDDLNARKLILLSSASAFGSAAAYHLALLSIGNVSTSNLILIATVIGDALGTWTIIYALKLILNLGGILLSK